MTYIFYLEAMVIIVLIIAIFPYIMKVVINPEKCIDTVVEHMMEVETLVNREVVNNDQHFMVKKIMICIWNQNQKMKKDQKNDIKKMYHTMYTTFDI